MRKRLHIINRLNELKYYRDNGLTKFKDVEVFNADKIKREKELHKVRLRKNWIEHLRNVISY